MIKKTVEDDSIAVCLTCKYGHFTNDIPLQGECRFNPPRAIFDRSGASTGRNFVQVKFDDWCGKLHKKVTPETKSQLEKLRPYLSPEDMTKTATRAMKDGNHAVFLPIFELLFESNKMDSELIFKVSEKTLDALKVDSEQESLRSAFVMWQRRAADMDHPRACYLFALTLVQSEFLLMDEPAAKNYFLRAAELGDSTAKSRIDAGDFPKFSNKGAKD